MTLTEQEAIALYPFVQKLTVHELKSNRSLFTAVMKIAGVAVDMQEANPETRIGIEKWQADAINHLLGGNKVNCIKEIRAATGMGLKEAKDISDHLQDHVSAHTNYTHVGRANASCLLDTVQQGHLSDLKIVFNTLNK